MTNPKTTPKPFVFSDYIQDSENRSVQSALRALQNLYLTPPAPELQETPETQEFRERNFTEQVSQLLQADSYVMGNGATKGPALILTRELKPKEKEVLVDGVKRLVSDKMQLMGALKDFQKEFVTKNRTVYGAEKTAAMSAALSSYLPEGSFTVAPDNEIMFKRALTPEETRAALQKFVPERSVAQVS